MVRKVFEFTVPGQPVSKGRPRVFHGHAVTPKRTVDAERHVLSFFRAYYPTVQALTGSVRVRIRFFMADKRRVDTDNLVKLVCDALNGQAFKDDSQIVDLQAVKILPGLSDGQVKVLLPDDDSLVVSGVPFTPCTLVEIWSLDDE